MRFTLLLFIAFFGFACTGTSESGATINGANDATQAQDTAEAEDACWWCVDGGDSSVPDSLTVSPPPGKDPGAAQKQFIVWSGLFDTKTGQGEYKYDVQLKDRVCHVIYAVDDLTVTEDCTECAAAYTFTVGDTVDTNAPDLCPKGLNQSGTTRSYGHSTADSNLLKKTDEEWTEVGSSSLSNEAMSWQFYDLSDNPSGGKGDKEPELDTACYDACIAKGADKTTCTTACGQGGKDMGGGKDGGDKDTGGGKDTDTAQECYSQCLDEGGTVEECKESCYSNANESGNGRGGK